MQENFKTNQLTEEKLKEKLKSCYGKWFDSLTEEEKEIFFDSTSFLSEETSLSERRYYFVRSLKEIQLCPVCRKRIPFLRCKLAMFCSKECRLSEEGEKIVREITINNFSKKYNISRTKEELKEKLKILSYRCDLLTDEELNLLKEYTSFLSDDTSFKERMYYLINDLSEVQMCPVCGKKISYNEKKSNLNVFCSEKCKNSEKGKKIIQEKTEKTCIKKFGVKRPALNNDIKKKMQETTYLF